MNLNISNQKRSKMKTKYTEDEREIIEIILGFGIVILFFVGFYGWLLMYLSK
jgi:hypothetical protein